MISFINISKSFGPTHALDSISLTLEAGRTHVLIGPSGSGKSTLLKIMLGLLPPDVGSIKVAQTLVTSETQREIALQTGYVIQEGGLFPHLTAGENASLVARSQGWNKEKISNRLRELSQLVRLNENLFKKYPKHLSGGERQRVGLVRALMLDPHLLVMDEPLGALDPLVRASLQTDLKEIFTSLQKTVVLVTHDLAEAAFFGDTVNLLHKGRLIQSGAFTDLVKNPTEPFVREFLDAQRPPPLLREMV